MEQGQDRLSSVPAEPRARLRALPTQDRRDQGARALLGQQPQQMLHRIDTIAEPRLLPWPPSTARIPPVPHLHILEPPPWRGLEAFGRGEFDQIEIIGQADERDFLERGFQEKWLEALAASLPTAREKEEVPRWFFPSPLFPDNAPSAALPSGFLAGPRSLPQCLTCRNPIFLFPLWECLG
jgi:hypothetical protein